MCKLIASIFFDKLHSICGLIDRILHKTPEQQELSEAKQDFWSAINRYDERMSSENETYMSFVHPIPGMTAEEYREAANEWDKKGPENP